MGHIRRMLGYWPEVSFGGLIAGAMIGGMGLYEHLSSPSEAVPSWALAAEMSGGALVVAGAIGAIATLGIEIGNRNHEDM